MMTAQAYKVCEKVHLEDPRVRSKKFIPLSALHCHITMPRTTTKATGKSRHDPLLVQLREDDEEAKYGRVSKPGRRAKDRGKAGTDADAPADDSTILDPKTSRRIFELARDQQVELGVLDDDGADDDDAEDDSADAKLRPRIAAADDDEEEEEYEVEEYEVDAEDEFVSACAGRPLERGFISA
jgi:essential nuclear protein 1